ncbi:hypothetical protein WNY37_00910 [Henriciella sp. AS95]|uniref:hypothetical protein n=1 Tax=Henriciella sp. AS95 TaxID=3135782 RepID=UPI003182ABE1
MRSATSSLSIKVILAALFIWVQGAALFDAAAHGEAPHDHYGVACELTKAVATKVAPVPVCNVLPAPPVSVVTATPFVQNFRSWSRPPGQAPPPRSPPTFHQ